MTGKLTKPTLVALYSIALRRQAQSSTVLLGDMSIVDSLIKVDEIVSTLQACLDSTLRKN